jgi:hypothetical protein
VEAQMFVGGEYFPKAPQDFEDFVTVFENPIYEFHKEPYAAIGGQNNLLKELGLNTDKTFGTITEVMSEIISKDKYEQVIYIIIAILLLQLYINK